MTEQHEKLAANRAMWDDRVPVHVRSQFYDVDGFLAGRIALQPFEIEQVGVVEGLDLVHLQCHFGLDSLSWARLGAHVVGLDFSEPAIESARALAARSGIDAEFVAGDVYDAPAVVGGRSFDVVYTGLGALNWLPDIGSWADVVSALLRPGGFLYLAEFHPVHAMLGDDDLTVALPYWSTAEGHRWDDPGTYTDGEITSEHTESWEWNHALSEVIGALLDRGFVLESFDEYPYTLFPRWPFMIERDRTYRLPDGMPSVPLMYSLKARRRP